MQGDYLIWHNPRCSTSRFVLQALIDAGVDPVVRDYQKQPPTGRELRGVLEATGLTPRQLLRRKSDLYRDLGLDDPSLGDDALIETMAAHPELIERPIVFAPKGARLCRPRESVFDLLPGAD